MEKEKIEKAVEVVTIPQGITPKYKSQVIITDNEVIRSFLKIDEFLIKNQKKTFSGEEVIDIVVSDRMNRDKSAKILKKLFDKKLLVGESKEFKEDESYSLKDKLFLCKTFQIKAEKEDEAILVLSKYK